MIAVMTEKACFKCGLIKSICEFYEHSRMKDGHLGKCKECTRADVSANRSANIEAHRGYDRERGKLPNRRNKHQEKDRRKRHNTIGYTRSHSAVTRAVAKGALIRPSVCTRCPATDRIQAHHDDYTKPLDVMWLCPVCHAQRHKELGRLHVAKARSVYDAPMTKDNSVSIQVSP